jgi:lyso-ornithine lipid O-acyltransferase
MQQRRPEIDRRLARAERLQLVARELCRVHGFELRVDGILPDEPAVLVANHVSYVDPVALAALAPCTVVAKGEVRGWPILGGSASTLGVLFVERGCALSGARVLRQSWRALDAGASVLGFPEGTTTRGDDVLPFKRGLFGLALLARVPIIPIAIHYESPELRWVGDSWFLPHYLRTAMRPSSRIRIRVGAPLSSSLPAELAAERARAAVRAMLARVRG